MSACAVCGGGPLEPHLRVAGELGAAGLIPTTDQFGTALGDIFRCAACGHMQLEPMPDESVLATAYQTAASDDYVGEEAGQRETARRVLAQIERWQPSRGALLDLGCWVGFLMSEAKARGWQPLGVEPSDFGARYAREQLGLEVLQAGLFEAELAPESFDAITLGDVIEHLIEPGEAVARIRALLKPGGVVWMALPDAGSAVARALGKRWWSVIPTHVQYFTRGSIARLLERGGLEVLELGTSPKAFTVRYYLERIEGYSPAAGEALVKTAELAGIAERMWAPDFRDRLAVVARRPL
jgi:SAM-dependent methyltransferase